MSAKPPKKQSNSSAASLSSPRQQAAVLSHLHQNGAIFRGSTVMMRTNTVFNVIVIGSKDFGSNNSCNLWTQWELHQQTNNPAHLRNPLHQLRIHWTKNCTSLNNSDKCTHFCIPHVWLYHIQYELLDQNHMALYRKRTVLVIWNEKVRQWLPGIVCTHNNAT